jgi:hypothetical protein
MLTATMSLATSLPRQTPAIALVDNDVCQAGVDPTCSIGLPVQFRAHPFGDVFNDPIVVIKG